jgi:hypothetical protein
MDDADGQAYGARMLRVEAVEQQIAAAREHDQQRSACDDCHLDELTGGDAQHVADEDVVEVLFGLDLGEQHQPEAEHAREHDAHHRVLLHAAVRFEVAGRDSAE